MTKWKMEKGELFQDDTEVCHFVIVSNRWDMEEQALLEWQRAKAGTIEQVHHILVNELARPGYSPASSTEQTLPG